MITVKEALQLVNNTASSFGTESIDLGDAIGRVLQEDWLLDRDLPPYDRVTMDGIAFQYVAFDSGQRSFQIEAVAPAGSPQKQLQDATKCIEVMTGAVMPMGTDVVVRYEDVTIKDGEATVNIDAVKQFQNIHSKGTDKIKGTIIVPSGSQITAAELGIGCSIGEHRVKVKKSPRAMIISTGDELVDIRTIPMAHQIRKSNVYQIKAALEGLGLEPSIDHLDDDKKTMTQKLEKHLRDYDLLILSGGVSKGKFDFIPEVLQNLGSKKLFHKVKQRPGKPFWFGQSDNCTIFGLPGNPISSFLCTHKYVKEWIEHSMGKTSILKYAQLTEDIPFRPDLTYFALVKIDYDKNGLCLATPKLGNGSGDISSLLKADAFIELPQGQDVYKVGEVYKVLPYRSC